MCYNINLTVRQLDFKVESVGPWIRQYYVNPSKSNCLHRVKLYHYILPIFLMFGLVRVILFTRDCIILSLPLYDDVLVNIIGRYSLQ